MIAMNQRVVWQSRIKLEGSEARMRHVLMSVIHLAIVMAVLSAPSAAIAGDAPPQPINIDKLLQELRDLDTSTDTQGDHVVGETLC